MIMINVEIADEATIVSKIVKTISVLKRHHPFHYNLHAYRDFQKSDSA